MSFAWRMTMKRKVKRKLSPAMKVREISLKETQGVSGFSGSSYNSKGSADHGKITSNKKRR
jgi:hypothetical protein